MRKLRILHLITAIVRGGAENHLVSLAQEQKEQGHQVRIAYLKGDGYWSNFLQSIGIEVTDLHLNYYGDLAPIFKLRKLIRDLSPDIIHAHLPPAELYARAALLGTSPHKLPLIISKHNDEPFYPVTGQHWLGQWTAQRAARIIAISEAVKNNTCIQDLALPPQKTKTIYYGINPSPYENITPETIQALRSSWNVKDETYLIGTVCRLVPQKAIHVLLAGFKSYLQQAAQLTKLVIIGKGPLETELKQHAIALGIEQDVIWAGFREDIPAVMNSIDLFTLTSIYEGLGLVLLEAMAASKPIVASNVSAIPEIVKDQSTGILVPPQQSDLLAEAFRTCEDAILRQKIGANGKQHVLQNFTLASMVEQTNALYREVLEEKR